MMETDGYRDRSMVLMDLPRSQWLADAAVNVAGVIAALAGGFVLVFAVVPEIGLPGQAALCLYAFCVLASFLASAVYNSGPFISHRAVLRRLDHGAIYIKIAGTATPFMVMSGSSMAWGGLVIIWGLSLYGAVKKIVFWSEPGKYDPYLYLVLAWSAAIPTAELIGEVPARMFLWMASGGLLYTAGVLVYVRDTMPFSRAIWHLFVLAAATCFFVAIILGTIATLAVY
ncbi:PAQR family membrane homeostasis protein TrhA [Litorisediminicola beolgyonensis]|uniref:Hemolysin III family protein n=1 Tax=Litorisediminicola beolgyonensis TaxID=1173614 RepID=A0ABW3ZIM9_9RHOB